MAEVRTVIDQEKVRYSGLVNPKDLFATVDKWLSDKSYVIIEIENFEKVTDAGKEIYVLMRPFRKTSDYVKHIVEIELKLSNLVDAQVVKDDKRINMKKGDVEITISAFLETDYEGHWEKSPMLMFVRTLYDKFFFRSHIEKFEDSVKEDVLHLKSVLKSFLNLYRY